MQPSAAKLNNPNQDSRSIAWLTRLRRSSFLFPLLGLIAVSVVMIITTENFLSSSNFINIARQVSINAIIAVGMT